MPRTEFYVRGIMGLPHHVPGQFCGACGMAETRMTLAEIKAAASRRTQSVLDVTDEATIRAQDCGRWARLG